MTSILLPVDFSERSAAAAKYAAAIIRDSQADLTVLHVAPDHPPYVNVNGVVISAPIALEVSWDELRQNEATGKMTEFVSSHLHDIPCASHVRTGDAAKVIVDEAHTSGADLVIMSTHGFGGFRRMLLGSVTAKVLHDVHCPVFTSSHAESDTGSVPSFRTILCAIDLGLQSESVLRWAGEFARSMGAHLFVVHVLPVIPMGEWGNFDADLSAPIRKDAEDRAQSLVEKAGAEAELLVETGGVVETLQTLVEVKHADLLVIGRHHASGIFGRLRDTAYAIIRESPCPVVSV